MGKAGCGRLLPLKPVAGRLCILINVRPGGVRVFLPVTGLATGLVGRSFLRRLAKWSSLGNRRIWRGGCQWPDVIECSHNHLPRSATVRSIYRQSCKFLAENYRSRQAAEPGCLAIVRALMRESASHHQAVLIGGYCHAGAQQKPE
jgi:hypothetical protein